MPRERVTGAWVVKSYRAHIDDTAWLLGGPHDAHTIRAWWSWGGYDDARVYPSRAAAQRAMKGYHAGEGEQISYVKL